MSQGSGDRRDRPAGASSTPTVLSATDPAYAGQSHYTESFLRIYDRLVLGFLCRFIWRCPTRRLVEHYRRHTGPHHLDVGPGTGYFLERVPPMASLTLVDPNLDVLDHCAARLTDLHPTIVAADVLKPLPITARFDSIALNYVLHCLPGPPKHKARAIDHLLPLVEPGGVLFGATILGDLDCHTTLSRPVLTATNRRGVFDNRADTEHWLRSTLEGRFDSVDVELVGSVALFSARGPKPGSMPLA